MKARSYRFPQGEEYTETHQYDEETNMLDVGFQSLRVLKPVLINEYKNLTVLLIDYNELSELPSPDQLPNISRLSACRNKFKTVPFYPTLKEMNISRNQISTLSESYADTIHYLDVSHNIGFNLSFCLKICHELYINDCELKTLRLSYIPRVIVLDCSNNKLKNIDVNNVNLSTHPMKELDISINEVEILPSIMGLSIINADHNNIINLQTFPKLEDIQIRYNKLRTIANQPYLMKLIAKKNDLISIGKTPSLRHADLCHNKLKNITGLNQLEVLCLNSNPMKDFDLNMCLTSLKELHVGYELYQKLYDDHHDKFIEIEINPDIEKIDEKLELLSKYEGMYDPETREYIKKKFCHIKFGEHHETIVKTSLKVFKRSFMHMYKDVKVIRDAIEKKEFKYIMEQINNLYHNTLIVIILLKNDMPIQES